jgi:hypothetical protein
MISVQEVQQSLDEVQSLLEHLETGGRLGDFAAGPAGI